MTRPYLEQERAPVPNLAQIGENSTGFDQHCARAFPIVERIARGLVDVVRGADALAKLRAEYADQCSRASRQQRGQEHTLSTDGTAEAGVFLALVRKALAPWRIADVDKLLAIFRGRFGGLDADSLAKALFEVTLTGMSHGVRSTIGEADNVLAEKVLPHCRTREQADCEIQNIRNLEAHEAEQDAKRRNGGKALEGPIAPLAGFREIMPDGSEKDSLGNTVSRGSARWEA